MKKKKIKFITIILCLFSLFSLYTFNNLNYNKKTIEIFKNKDIYDFVKTKKYSKTLEEIINTNYFDNNYLDSYFSINYQDDPNFLENITNLLNSGYDSSYINNLYDNFNFNDISIISSLPYDEDILNYLSLDYFNYENLTRYIEFKTNVNKFSYSFFKLENYNLSYQDIVTYVNINLDKDYYSYDIDLTTNEANKLDVIVNKYHKLNKDYEPTDLEEIDKNFAINNQLLRKDAKIAFEKMAHDAKLENIMIYAGSSYRSYEYQDNLYNYYVKNDGVTVADTYAARAGYSEHQLGLAVDILGKDFKYIDDSSFEYSWLVANCYKYGFILRYPKGKEHITGYMFEDWHFRYLGVDLATKVTLSGLTYDEYVARFYL